MTTLSSRKVLTGALAGLVFAGGVAASVNDAEARSRNRGAAIAAGVIGGLALGALAARPAYSSPAYPTYYGAPVYDAPSCYTVRRRFVDDWGRVIIRREEVCE